MCDDYNEHLYSKYEKKVILLDKQHESIDEISNYQTELPLK